MKTYTVILSWFVFGKRGKLLPCEKICMGIQGDSLVEAEAVARFSAYGIDTEISCIWADFPQPKNNSCTT